MFTLIKREIEDHLAYFLGAASLSVVLVILLISSVYNYKPVQPPLLSIGLSIPAVIVLILGLPAMGATQMYTDRNRRVSAFLSALPVARGQILVARVVTGILAILTVLLPLTVTAVVLQRLFAPPVPIYPGVISDTVTTAFLLAFGCYCLGLQAGWTSSKATPTLGALALTLVLVTVIPVKGFGSDASIILVLFIVACLIRTWQKFKSTAL
jgi:hypothetical protein